VAAQECPDGLSEHWRADVRGIRNACLTTGVAELAATPSTIHCGQRTGTVNRCVVATPADVLLSIDQAARE